MIDSTEKRKLFQMLLPLPLTLSHLEEGTWSPASGRKRNLYG